MTKPPKPAPKGHWPKGKRRNADPNGDWDKTVLALESLLGDCPEPGVVSLRAVAKAVGVSARAVQKWLRGENRPDPETQDLIGAWVRQRRAEIKRRRKQPPQ